MARTDERAPRIRNRLASLRLVFCALLCSVVILGVLDVHTVLPASQVLQVPELNVGFRLLYNLKFEEARS